LLWGLFYVKSDEYEGQKIDKYGLDEEYDMTKIQDDEKDEDGDYEIVEDNNKDPEASGDPNWKPSAIMDDEEDF
jgi:hypothetical protein